mmetsp:Transcript_77526/g.224992  ORF Transcript_77526/g.224992 Transcript_77526/m.224992 type:complete len:205 (+) Transcript_77526:883-1497(+)
MRALASLNMSSTSLASCSGGKCSISLSKTRQPYLCLARSDMPFLCSMSSFNTNITVPGRMSSIALWRTWFACGSIVASITRDFNSETRATWPGSSANSRACCTKRQYRADLERSQTWFLNDFNKAGTRSRPISSKVSLSTYPSHSCMEELNPEVPVWWNMVPPTPSLQPWSCPRQISTGIPYWYSLWYSLRPPVSAASYCQCCP